MIGEVLFLWQIVDQILIIASSLLHIQDYLNSINFIQFLGELLMDSKL